MPSGRTHDRITLWTLPLVTLLAGLGTRSATLALITGGTYLFSGLMFGGDLDIRSQQYYRWLWLRWIWLPYRRCLRHRSLWSHGPVIGTTLRLVYVAAWVGAIAIPLLYLGHRLQAWPWQPTQWLQTSWQWVFATTPQGHHQNWELLAWIWIGLEFGAMSHSLSDWTGSAWKRHVANRSRTARRPKR